MEHLKSSIANLTPDELSELSSEIDRLRSEQCGKREKIAEMSSEVVDSNPYSRLMALKRMGIVENYEKIRGFSVAIVGIGEHELFRKIYE